MTNNVEKALFEITPEIQHYSELCIKNNFIQLSLLLIRKENFG